MVFFFWAVRDEGEGGVAVVTATAVAGEWARVLEAVALFEDSRGVAPLCVALRRKGKKESRRWRRQAAAGFEKAALTPPRSWPTD